MPPLAIASLTGSPVDGSTKAATAEMPKQTEPSRFQAAICQSRSRGRNDSQRCSALAKASVLASRKQAEPITSGTHTRTSCSWAVSAWSSATKVLTLKRIVPGNWTAAATQSTRCGSQPRGRSSVRSCLGRPRCGASLAATSCSSAALVKKIEPAAKPKPIHVALDPSAASAGIRNSSEPSANSAPVHHAIRSGRHIGRQSRTPVGSSGSCGDPELPSGARGGRRRGGR